MENNNNEIVVKQLTKELRMTRIFCIISSLLTVCLLAVGFLIWVAITPVVSVIQEAQPVMEQLSGLDVEEMNHTLEQVNVTLESVDWQQVSEALEALDVETINEAIAGLDTEEMTKAVENLNKVASMLENWSNKWSAFF